MQWHVFMNHNAPDIHMPDASHDNNKFIKLTIRAVIVVSLFRRTE